MMWVRLMLLICCLMGSFTMSGQMPKDTLDYIDLCDVPGKLSEWKGRTIFISFWSKSCGPCIRSFRRDNKLRNQLIEDGVILLNVSIDNRAEWFVAQEKYRPSGINVRTASFEAAQDQFEIFNLPVYITIDQHGNRVEYDKQLYGNVNDFYTWYIENDKL